MCLSCRCCRAVTGQATVSRVTVWPSFFELPDEPAGVGLGVAFVVEPGRSEVLVGLVALQHVVGADQHRRVRDGDDRPVVSAPRREPRELRRQVAVLRAGGSRSSSRSVGARKGRRAVPSTSR